MAQILTKFAAKKMLSKQMDKNKHKEVAGQYDPYYCMIENPRKPGKMKKVKRQIPDYIPEHDAIILAKMRQRAYMLDMSLFNLGGIRFGWSSVIGLIPAAGDAIDGALAFLLFLRCSKVECGLDSNTKMLMLFNILIDFVVGLVPIIGDLADAAIRANSKNVRLLEKRLDKVYKPKERDEADRRSKHPLPPATVYEEFSDDEDHRLPRHNQDVHGGANALHVPGSGDNSPRGSHHSHGSSHRSHGSHNAPRAPEAARIPVETKGGDRMERRLSKGGKLSKSNSRRERRNDVEMSERGDRRR